MTQIKVDDIFYPATIEGKIADKDWDNRETKSITIKTSYEVMNSLFKDNVSWSIVLPEKKVYLTDESGEPLYDENGNHIYEIQQTEYDNSEYSIRGNLTVHTDGTCTVKMGKPTDLEVAYEMLYGGII